MLLGKLEEVDIRMLWKHEQYDFSTWLSEPENMERLNEVIGLTLTDIRDEVSVGAYRCDLVGVDEASGAKVIIENQLTLTDHDHLGKIITYASGVDADVVVWITRQAREEHKSAIEWLNNKTDKDISFFLIEIHAYRIGDSIPAPKFEVIEKPNDFSKNIKAISNQDELSKSQLGRLQFWTEFNEFVLEKGKPFNIRKASTDNWYNVAIGIGGAYLSISLVNQRNEIGIGLVIINNKDLFDRLESQRDKIEEDLGFAMEWQRLDGRKASQAIYYIDGLDFERRENYPELMEEIIEKVIISREVFRRYIL